MSIHRDFFFSGHFVAEQPLSYTTPNSKDGLPLMGGKLYMMASGIRGALRRSAEQVVTDARHWKPSLEDYFSMVLGGAKGGGKDDAAGLIPMTRFVREKNPLLSLFGGMAPVAITGKLKVSHAVAQNVKDNGDGFGSAGEVPVKPVVVNHVRTNDMTRNPAIFDRLDDRAPFDYVAFKGDADERSELAREEKLLNQQVRKASAAKDADTAAALMEKKNAVKTEKQSKTVVQLALPDLGYEAIPAGTILSNEFVLLNATDTEAGLFLAALDRFSFRPYLGGHQNHGLGRVSGRWTVTARDASSRASVEMGEVILPGDMTPLRMTGAVCDLYGESFLSTLASDAFDFTVKGLMSA